LKENITNVMKNVDSNSKQQMLELEKNA